MIHNSRIYDLVETHEFFSISFIKKSTGDKVEIEKCTCTSSSNKHRTINIKIFPSEEIRKVKVCSIIKFNDVKVYI